MEEHANKKSIGDLMDVEKIRIKPRKFEGKKRVRG